MIMSHFKYQKTERRHKMKKIAGRLEETFTDITFAEDREFKAVGDTLKKAAQIIEDTFAAIALAEAGKFEAAASAVNRDGEAPRSRRSGYPPKRFNKLCSGRA